ncbi:MAG: hypothetical protein ACXQTS_05920, partial [Candidatus Methanospirareceae archaeon]
ALSILTYKYLGEIRQKRIFRLQKEHTERLKREVIEPWLNELERIDIARKENPPCPIIGRVYSGGAPEADTVLTYKGDDLKVENRDLFDDLRNHVDSTLFQNYDKFKEKSKELSKKYEDFKRRLEGDLSTKLRILSWDEFYRSINSIDHLSLENTVQITGSASIKK